MSNQILISSGAKLRDLDDVIIGTDGVLTSLGFNVANGVPKLDENGKILVSQLPNSVMEFKGVWNAATNTPTLADGTGNAGDVYLCNVAGTVNFGSGPIAFAVGDYAVYTGTVWARSSGATGTVTSVGLSRSGDALTVTGSPITTSGTINIGFAGTNLQYINGAGNLVTFPTIAAEAQRLITEVYNETGATLTKGTVVYINGGHGNLPTITKAIATGDATSAQTYGIVQNDIGNNNNGFVVVIGSLMDLDTQAYPEGTQLYLSGTTAGAWTSTKPYAPVHLVYVAIVTRSHPTQGVVEVSIQNGYEMDELHNVSAQNPDNNDILQYKTATSLWTKVAGTTSNIAEGSNQYFTDARARLAISLTTTGSTGAATYDNTTGVLNIPNYVDQYVGTVTSVGLSAPTGFSVTGSPVTSSGTLALAFASGYSLPTNVKQSNWDDAYTWVAAFPTQTGNTGKFLTTDGSTLSWAANPLGTVTSVAMSVPTGLSIAGSPITTSGTLAVTFTAGYSIPTNASQTNWDTAYTNRITSLTTTGSSGSATLISNILNIPTYTLAGLGGVPTTRTLTINGVAQDLSADRTWTITAGISSVSGTAPISVSTVGGAATVSIATANTTTTGALTSTDWNTFNGKQNALTNPVTGTGTNKYIPKFTGSTTIGDSSINDNGGYVAINGTAGSIYALDVYASNSSYNLRLFQPLTATDTYNTIYITGNQTTVAAYFGIGGSTTGNASFRSVAVIGTQSAHPLVFNTSDTQQMRLFANGNFLIGTSTTDAGYKLDVIGTARVNGRLTITDNGTNFPILVNNQTTQQYISIESATGFEAMSRYYNPTANNWYAGIRTAAGLGSTSSYHIYSQTYGNDVFAINTDGSAVFATSVTAATLNISSSASSLAAFNSTDTNGGYIRFRRSGSDFGLIGSAYHLTTPAGANTDFAIATNGALLLNTGSSLNERVRVTNSGFVGIGTSTPNYKLSVSTAADVWHMAIGDVSDTGKMIRIGGYGGGGTYGVIGAYSTFSNGSPIPLVLQRDGSVVYIGTASGVSGGGLLQVNGDVNINGSFKINGTVIGGGGGSGVTGSGTNGYLSKWTGSTSLGNSGINEDGGGFQLYGGSSSGQSSTSTPKYLRFNNDYSNNYTDASLKLYIFNSGATIQGIGAGPNYDMQYHSSGSDVGRHSFYAQNSLSMTVGLNRVGVNINPSYTFQVYKDSDVWHAVIGGASGQLRIGAQTSDGAVIQSRNEAGTYRQVYLQRDGGNVILGGTTDNGYKLQINGGTSFAYGYLTIYRGSSGANDIFVGNDGSRIYIGGNTYVVGNVTATGGFFDTSDARLKNLVEDNYLLSSIANVKAKLYKKDGRMELGYYAQDLLEILPSAVKEGSDGFLSLSYAQVHTAKIAVIEDEVAILKNRVSELEKQLNLN